MREAPFITHNIEMTRKAFALDRIEQHPFPADGGVEAVDAAHNQDTLQNIRLWDWRALQDTLRQIQEIRTYYDFPDIDIDRYAINGSIRQMMLADARAERREAAREQPQLDQREADLHARLRRDDEPGQRLHARRAAGARSCANMPVQSTIPSLKVTRPEIYFGELTNTDVYVKTRQKEFNYPQGETNSLTSYEGNGGIVLGGFFRRLIIALDRGDLAKLPFSDDVTRGEPAADAPQHPRPRRRRSRRSSPSTRIPYIVVGEDGRLAWMMDGFTTSESYPVRAALPHRTRAASTTCATASRRSSTPTTAPPRFYVFDTEDPIIAAYRGVFPSLFKDAIGDAGRRCASTCAIPS